MSTTSTAPLRLLDAETITNLLILTKFGSKMEETDALRGFISCADMEIREELEWFMNIMPLFYEFGSMFTDCFKRGEKRDFQRLAEVLTKIEFIMRG